MTRRELNKKVLTGEVTYRDSFASMLDSVKLPFEECKQILRDSMFPLPLHSQLLMPMQSFAMRCARVQKRAHSADIGLDPGFKEFYTYCKSNNIPVVIVSR